MFSQLETANNLASNKMFKMLEWYKENKIWVATWHIFIHENSNVQGDLYDNDIAMTLSDFRKKPTYILHKMLLSYSGNMLQKA